MKKFIALCALSLICSVSVASVSDSDVGEIKKSELCDVSAFEIPSLDIYAFEASEVYCLPVLKFATPVVIRKTGVTAKSVILCKRIKFARDSI